MEKCSRNLKSFMRIFDSTDDVEKNKYFHLLKNFDFRKNAPR